MRRNHKNIRTEFKYLWKDFERRQIGKSGIENWLREKGFLADAKWLNLILKNTKVSPRIIARLGKAAKKQGKLVKLVDIYWVARYKDGCSLATEVLKRYKKATDYNLIEFVEQNFK